MFVAGFFANLFGGKKKSKKGKKRAKAAPVSGVEHIGGGVAVHSIGAHTPDFWGGWDPNDLETFVARSSQMNAARNTGDQAQIAALLAEWGLADLNSWDAVENTYIKHYNDDPRYTQAQVNLAMNQQKAEMAAAVSPEQLAPCEGVDIQTYATVMARKMQLTDPSQVHALLAEYGLDEARFNLADQQWQARMRQADDPMAMAAIATEYGKHFAAAGQGQYGAAGQAAAPGMEMNAAAGAAPAAGAEPCTLERYAEIQAAQTVWSQQGQDVNAMLQQVFGMTAMDWSNMGAYWSQKFMSDYTLMEKMMKIQEQYEAKYRAGSAGPDDDLSI